MKLKLNSHDIKLTKLGPKNYSFRLNKDIKVEGIPSRQKAFRHAEELLKIIFKATIK